MQQSEGRATMTWWWHRRHRPPWVCFTCPSRFCGLSPLLCPGCWPSMGWSSLGGIKNTKLFHGRYQCSLVPLYRTSVFLFGALGKLILGSLPSSPDSGHHYELYLGKFRSAVGGLFPEGGRRMAPSHPPLGSRHLRPPWVHRGQMPPTHPSTRGQQTRGSHHSFLFVLSPSQTSLH